MYTKSYETEPRKLIREYISKTKGAHLTADDVFDALKKEGFRVGKATIYRYFEKLAEEGTLRKYSPVDGSSACYEYVGSSESCKNHYHLKCDVCGSLFHLECSLLDKISEHIEEEHDFEINKFKTVFYGTCALCRDAQRRSGAK